MGFRLKTGRQWEILGNIDQILEVIGCMSPGPEYDQCFKDLQDYVATEFKAATVQRAMNVAQAYRRRRQQEEYNRDVHV